MLKHPFTLIELLIVLTLIAIGLSTFSLPISKVVKKERFERGVDQLIAKLMLAQELMLDFHTHVDVYLKEESEGISCILQTDKQLPSHLEHSVNLHHKIHGIAHICFEDSFEQEVVLTCDPSFKEISQGVLKVSAGSYEEVIYLKGYPSNIKRGFSEKKLCQIPYPEEIFSSF